MITREPEPNLIVEQEVDRRARALEKLMDGDVLTYSGPIYPGADDAIRDAIESRTKLRSKLVVVLETSGGYIEVTQRIADTMRHYYTQVEFIVPNSAMSAGTVLVMSGDAIHMDFYSVLGPIDPQIERSRPDGKRFVPALGYLIKYEELIDKSRQGTLTTAELAFLLERFDPAELHEFEQARELSKSLLKQWLAVCKFKDWHKTRDRGLPVTQAMREQRAGEIADKLSATERWHTHGRGISMEVLQREINLQVDDFGSHPELNGKIRGYYKALTDYWAVMGLDGATVAGIHVPTYYRLLPWR